MTSEYTRPACALPPVAARVIPAEEFRAFLASSGPAALLLLVSVCARLRVSDRRNVEFVALDSVGRRGPPGWWSWPSSSAWPARAGRCVSTCRSARTIWPVGPDRRGRRSAKRCGPAGPGLDRHRSAPGHAVVDLAAAAVPGRLTPPPVPGGNVLGGAVKLPFRRRSLGVVASSVQVDDQ